MPGAGAETYLPTAGERVCTRQGSVFAFCNRCPVCRARAIGRTKKHTSGQHWALPVSPVREVGILGLLYGRVSRFVWL